MSGSRSISRPMFARAYAGLAGPALARAGIGEHRAKLLAGLAGQVVEIGAGNGLNFRYYPPEVSRVVAVEPEPRLRELAEEAARSAPVAIDVVDGCAERVEAADASFDAAVACLVLCSVAEQRTALAELHRVLRPGGSLRFFEHVRARTPGMRCMQKAVDATFWPLLCGGCHTGRDTAAAITVSGFEITEMDRFPFPDTQLPSPAATHILGTAIRRENAP